jgi:hypothetical protein
MLNDCQSVLSSEIGHEEMIKVISRHGSYCSISRIRQTLPRVTQWAKSRPEHPQQILASRAVAALGYLC